jgi:hypothetical protein
MNVLLLLFCFSIACASNHLDLRYQFINFLDKEAEDVDLVHDVETDLLHGIYLDKSKKICFVGSSLSCSSDEENFFGQWGKRPENIQYGKEKIFFLNSLNNRLFDKALYCKSEKEYEIWSDMNDKGPISISTNNKIWLDRNSFTKKDLWVSTDKDFRSFFNFKIVSCYDGYRFKYRVCDDSIVPYFTGRLYNSDQAYFDKDLTITYFCSPNLVLNKSTNIISRLVRDDNKDDSKIIGLIPLCSVEEFNEVLKSVNDSHDQKKSLDGCVALFEGKTVFRRLKFLFAWYVIKIKYYLICIFQRCIPRNNKTA